MALAGATLYAAATVGSSLVLGAITDRVIVPAAETGATTVAAVTAGALVVVGMALAKVLGILGRRLGAYHMQRRLEADYRLRVTQRYTRLPLAWHRQHPTGVLLANANADIESAFSSIAPLPLSAGVLVLLGIAAVVLVAIDGWLALVALLCAPLIALVNMRFNAHVRRPATAAQQARGDVSAVAHESFEGGLVVKTLGREDAETERFTVRSEGLRDELIEVGRVRAVFDPMLESLPTLAVLALLVTGAFRLQAGAVTSGDLIVVTYLFGLLTMPLRVIGYLLGDLPRSVVGWDRVQRVLDADTEMATGETILRASGPAEVATRNLDFAHADGERILHDVSLGVRPGTVTALVGPTGSGKSTLAALLVRLADPSAGGVELDGVDLRELAALQPSAHTAIVFQDTFLFDDSVRENLTLGEPRSDAEIHAACELAQVGDVIAALPDGLETSLGEGGTSLSGGQRQRLALARALLRRPRLLILDDATSSVDPAVEARILDGLREANLPATVIVIAYRRATIGLADEILVVERGRVIGRGTHEELLARLDVYAELITAYEATAA